MKTWRLRSATDEDGGTGMTEEELREMFREIDADGSGYVDEVEVAALAKRLGAPLTKLELAAAMKEVRGSASVCSCVSALRSQRRR